jgi:hypothetical protein
METTPMMKLAARSLVSLAWLAGCAGEVPVDGLPCPCGTGYVCCPDDVCVPDGDACAANTPQPTQMADSPCSAVESANPFSHSEMDWTYLYDGAGNLVRGDATSPDGTSQAHELADYGAANRLTSLSYAVNGSAAVAETLGYDALGRITALDSSVGDVVDAYTYSGLDATETLAAEGMTVVTSSYVESQDGLRLSGTFTTSDGKSGTWTFGYDAANHPLFEQADDADGTLFERVAWTYDSDEQMLSMAESTGLLIQMTYDSQGRQATFTETSGQAVDVYTNHYCE